MFKLDPVRKWTDKVVKDIENDELRDYARIGFTIAHYVLIVVLALVVASVANGVTDAIVQIAKVAQAAPR